MSKLLPPAMPAHARREGMWRMLGVDVHLVLDALGELHLAGDEREKRVILATADVLAGVDVGAVLTNEDLAGVDLLACKALHAKALSVGVTTVAGGAETFLMSHF